jgi:hypothetical protein
MSERTPPNYLAEKNYSTDGPTGDSWKEACKRVVVPMIPQETMLGRSNPFSI